MHLANLRYQYGYWILIHNHFRGARESKGKSISHLSPDMDCMKNLRQTRNQSDAAFEKERGDAKIGLKLTRFDQMETAYLSEWRARLLWAVGGWCAVEQFCKKNRRRQESQPRFPTMAIYMPKTHCQSPNSTTVGFIACGMQNPINSENNSWANFLKRKNAAAMHCNGNAIHGRTTASRHGMQTNVPSAS